MREQGYDPDVVNLRYNVLDIRVKTKNGNGFWLPFMMFSSFYFNDNLIYGPFIAGHQAGLSMVQSSKEQKYTRFFLNSKLSDVFNSDLQTTFIADSISRLVDGHSSVVIPALPNRGRDPNEYGKSGIVRVLMGGHIKDTLISKFPLKFDLMNPLRSNPFSIVPSSIRAGYAEFYSTDFSFHKLTENQETNSLILNERFLSLLVNIRLMGPAFKSEAPEHTKGLLFSTEANLIFVKEFLEKYENA